MSVLTGSSVSAADQAGAYTSALLELLGGRDPLDVLRSTPATISIVVSGLAPAQIEAPERPGKWSIRHVVQHLGDAEMVVGVRLRQVLAEDRAPLIAYDQDIWANRLRYNEVPFADALEQFTQTRRVNLRLWAGLTEADQARVGIHTERGEESLGFMRKIHAGHDLAHLRQLSESATPCRHDGDSRGSSSHLHRRAAALIEVAGLRLLTDPTFDAAGAEFRSGAYVLQKTEDPAIDATQIGHLDAVLLSHDHHFDNLDERRDGDASPWRTG